MNNMSVIYRMFPLLIARIAPVVNTLQFIPQLYKVVSAQHVEGLSFTSLMLIIMTNLLWLIHGYNTEDYSLIIAATSNGFIGCLLMFCYFHFKKK